MQFLMIFNNFNDFYDFSLLCQNDESMCQICDTLIDSTPYVIFSDLYGPVTPWSQVSRPEKPWKSIHRLCCNDKIDDFDDFDNPQNRHLTMSHCQNRDFGRFFMTPENHENLGVLDHDNELHSSWGHFFKSGGSKNDLFETPCNF